MIVLNQYFKLFRVYLYLTVVAICFFLFGNFYYHLGNYYYLLWNLFLAWIPLIIAFYLKKILTKKLLSSWESMIIGLIWLIFIPNSFYLLSDYIHLQTANSNSILFNSLLFTIIIFTGVFMGFSSIALITSEIRKRFSKIIYFTVVEAIFLISSFGIYIGRDLRWNSWDIVINPAGLFLDVFHRLTTFSRYPSMLILVISYFIILTSLYVGFNKIVKITDKIVQF